MLLLTKVCSFYWGSLFVLHSSLGFDKCVMSRIHHYGFKQNNFTILKIPWASPVHHSIPPHKPRAATGHLTIAIAFPFPKCHIVAIIWCVSFSGWLLSLSNML